MNRRKFFRMLGMIGAVMALPAKAAASAMKQPAFRVCYWLHGGNGDWSDPANWSGGAVPRDGDDVVIGGGYVLPSSTDVQLNSFTINDKDARVGWGRPVENARLVNLNKGTIQFPDSDIHFTNQAKEG